MKQFRWFEKHFPDDIGEPGFRLCWTLALYRDGQEEEAAKKLRETMLCDLFLLPKLLGEEEELDVRPASNWEWRSHLAAIPPEYFGLWTEEERKWATDLYHSAEFQAIRERYIQIVRALKTEPVGPKRIALARQLSMLRGWELD